MNSRQPAPASRLRQQGSADAELLMRGVLFFLGIGAAVVCFSIFGGMAVWNSYFGTPEPTLAQRLEAERSFIDLKDERAILLAQLPKDTSELLCGAQKASHAMTCEMVEYGILKKTTRFRVTLPGSLPPLGLRFHAGTAERFTLEYDTTVPRDTRIAILRLIKRV